jgi:adenine-specific DNA-methyltransferase
MALELAVLRSVFPLLTTPNLILNNSSKTIRIYLQITFPEVKEKVQLLLTDRFNTIILERISTYMSEEVKAQRGQFFTVNHTVQKVMLGLIQTDKAGKILEPSAGEGHLVVALENAGYTDVTSVEFDPELTAISINQPIRASFFDFAATRDIDYSCIFGNPPYVAWKSLEKEQTENPNLVAVKKDYSDKANLYYLFMDKCIDVLTDNGEIIFIVPKEWLYTSSAAPLRKKMLETGSITHVVDCGEEKLFPDADVPAIVIFRFQKGLVSRKTNYATSLDKAVNDAWEERVIEETGDRLIFLDAETATLIDGWGVLDDFMSAKVGIVSGADPIFRVDDPSLYEKEGLVQYLTTKGLEWFIDVNHVASETDLPPKIQAFLLSHKKRLITRRIAKFDENNWWKYGAIRNRDAMLTDADRFYVYGKTRSSSPFFASPGAVFYSGGVMGVFVKDELPENVMVEDVVALLNSDIYRTLFVSMQLTTGNKLSLQPSTLATLPFPKTAEQFVTVNEVIKTSSKKNQ